MENFDDVSIFQNLLEAMRKGVELREVEDEATVRTQAHLYHDKAKVTIKTLNLQLT